MQVSVNYLAILAAAVFSMILGFVWYGYLFKKQWMELSGMTAEKMDNMKVAIGKNYGIMFVGSLVMAYVLAYALTFMAAYLKTNGVLAGVQVGFWNWLGFIAPVTLGTVLWDGKSWKLWLLNNVYWLLHLIVTGVILSVWR